MSRKEIYEDELDEGFSLETGSTHQIVVKRRMGKLHARLFDETGTFILADISYEGDGSFGTELSGETDGEGILLHADVPLEDYPVTVDGEYDVVIPAVPRSSAPHDQIVPGYQVEEEIRDELEGESEEVLLHFDGEMGKEPPDAGADQEEDEPDFDPGDED